MQLFLFIVEMPGLEISSQGNDVLSKWLSFLEESDKYTMPPGSHPRPAKNVWLFAAEGSDQFFDKLKSCTQKFQLNYSTYLISGEITLMTQHQENIDLSKVLT